MDRLLSINDIKEDVRYILDLAGKIKAGKIEELRKSFWQKYYDTLIITAAQVIKVINKSNVKQILV